MPTLWPQTPVFSKKSFNRSQNWPISHFAIPSWCIGAGIEVRADLGKSFDYFVTNVRHYTFKEQLLPVIRRLQPDLVHFLTWINLFFFSKNSSHCS